MPLALTFMPGQRRLIQAADERRRQQLRKVVLMPIEVEDFELVMPAGSKILTVSHDGTHLLVDIDPRPEVSRIPRRFKIVAAGVAFENRDRYYIGTCRPTGSPQDLHLFELTEVIE